MMILQRHQRQCMVFFKDLKNTRKKIICCDLVVINLKSKQKSVIKCVNYIYVSNFTGKLLPLCIVSCTKKEERPLLEIA